MISLWCQEYISNGILILRHLTLGHYYLKLEILSKHTWVTGVKVLLPLLEIEKIMLKLVLEDGGFFQIDIPQGLF